MAFNTSSYEGLDRLQHIEQYLAQTASQKTASLDFTDGDTFKRFTITDGSVAAASTVGCSIRRSNIADVDDPGWIFVPNVVTVAAGSFDVTVAVLSGDGLVSPGEFPNETVTLIYHVF